MDEKDFDFPLLMKLMNKVKLEAHYKKENDDAIVLIKMMKDSGVEVDTKHGIPSIQNLAEIACGKGDLVLLKKIIEYDPKYYFECHKLMCHAKDNIIADYIYDLIKLNYSDDYNVKLWGLNK